MFASCSGDLMSCSLSSKGRNAFTRKHSNDSVKMEIKIATWLLCTPYAYESIIKEGSYHDGWGDWSWLARENWTATPQLRSRILEIPLSISLYCHALWLRPNVKLQQPNPGRATNGPYLSGMKVQVTLLGKELWLAELLAEGKGSG